MIRTQKGITLIALILTIIILLILAGIGTYFGISSITKSKDNKLLTELNMIQHVALETYTNYISTSKVNINENSLVGTNLTGSEDFIETANGAYYFKYDGTNKIKLKDTNISNYYLISTKEEFKKLGISKAEHSYVVNYKTGEVINVTVLKNSLGEALYISNN